MKKIITFLVFVLSVMSIEDGKYMLSYNGKSYAFRSISDSRYDSTVIIDGQEYFFRVKPRSYE